MALHIKRLSAVFDIALSHNIDTIVLGAPGCNGFDNPPKVVAEALSEVIKAYRFAFKNFFISVYCADDNLDNFILIYKKLSENL
jgi:uncharacterized protein (TIGR02452 family)